MIQHCIRMATSAVALLALSACANLGGIDGASLATKSLSSGLEAATAAQNARADAIRGDQRSSLVRQLAGRGRADAHFVTFLCDPYGAYFRLRDRADIFAAAQFGLNELQTDSPTTLVGLTAAVQQGDAFPHKPASPIAVSALGENDCSVDAERAEHAVTASLEARDEAAAAAFLGIADVFKDLVLPILRQGLTRVDRQRRLTALRAWATRTPDVNSDASSLTAVMDELQAAALAADLQTQRRRREAAGEALLAWRALDAARKAGLPNAPCATVSQPQTSRVPVSTALPPREYFATDCVAARTKIIKDQSAAFLAAAAAYDKVFDADPVRPLMATHAQAERLKAFLAGNPTEEDALAMRAASIAAAYAWLGFFQKAEALWEDPKTKDKFRDAAENLRAAL